MDNTVKGIVDKMNTGYLRAYAADPYRYVSRDQPFQPTISLFQAFEKQYLTPLLEQENTRAIDIGGYLGPDSRVLAAHGVRADKIYSTNLKAGLRDIGFWAFAMPAFQPGQGRLDPNNFREPFELSMKDPGVRAFKGYFTHASMGSVLHTIDDQDSAVEATLSMLQPDENGVATVFAAAWVLDDGRSDVSDEEDDFGTLWTSFKGETPGNHKIKDVKVVLDGGTSGNERGSETYEQFVIRIEY